MARPDQQPGQQHPDEWRQDLNPAAPDESAPVRTAYDVKAAHAQLEEWDDDDLKQIPMLSPGSRLDQGATYLNLRDPNGGEFRAQGGMEVGQDDLFVSKRDVHYQLWNRLIGVQNPERLGEADEGETP